jgi:hypothetical protein
VVPTSLGAVLSLAPAGDRTTTLTLAGAYRPPPPPRATGSTKRSCAALLGRRFTHPEMRTRWLLYVRGPASPRDHEIHLGY